MRHRSGFTLIELSIVLVIIGLLVGGILVGRDLIEAAKIRAQVSQLEQYTAAVNTFRTKYDGLPGDIGPAQAAALGMAWRSGIQYQGDGDGNISNCFSWVGQYFGCESALFWNDLAVANLIAGDYSLDTDHTDNSAIPIPAGQQASYAPNAKIGNNASIAVFGATQTVSFAPILSGNDLQANPLYYAIVNLKTDASGSCVGNTTDGLTPRQAYAIDTKMDDGLPGSGVVHGGAVAITGALKYGMVAYAINKGLQRNLWVNIRRWKLWSG